PVAHDTIGGRDLMSKRTRIRKVTFDSGETQTSNRRITIATRRITIGNSPPFTNQCSKTPLA
ncbi:MAG: hypothetical protein ACR2GY_02555, partial [Phycisphaerales bacterium]